MIKVSVICITYNQEKFIKQALDGFLMQKTDFDFEVLIHDDASTDQTTNILKEYQKKYPNIIKSVYEKENQFSKGNVDFVNDMLRSSKGRYIAMCEGDDFWTDPYKLQKQVNFLDKHIDYALCFHPVRVFFEDGKTKDSVFPAENENAKFTVDNLLRANYIQTNSVMYRRQEYDSIPPNLIPGDWYLHLYHAQFGKIGFIDEIMSAYRRHNGGAWWGSQTDSLEFWRKRGLPHLILFAEILKLYGKNPEYKKLIIAHVDSIFSKLIRVDKKYKDGLLDKAVKVFPKDIAEIMLYQHNSNDSVVQTQQEHREEQAKIIAHLTNELNDLQRQHQNAMQELSRANLEIEGIRRSLTWRVVRHLSKVGRIK